MASGAVLGKHRAAMRQDGRFKRIGRELALELLGFGRFIGRSATDCSPDGCQALVDAIIVDRLKLADRKSGHVLARNGSCVDGVEQRECKSGPGSERLDRVLALGSVQ